MKIIQIMTLAFVLSPPVYTLAEAAENVVNIADGSQYVCLDELHPARTRQGNTYRKLSQKQIREVLAELQQRKRTLTQNFNKATKRGNEARANKISAKLATVEDTLLGIQACKKGELINACRVIGDQSEDQEELGAQIINGDLCPVGNSFAVQVEVSTATETARCTGFLVSERLVVTAAHCFYDKNHQPTAHTVKVTTVFGEHNASLWDHPTYIYEGRSSTKNDYAFVVLDTKVDGPRTVPVVGAGEGAQIGEPVVFGGFGKDEDGFSGFLEAGFNVITRKENSVLAFTYTDNPLHSNTCKGDSGGPLLVKRGDIWKVAGIVAAGTKANCTVGDLSTFVDLDQDSFLAGLGDYMSFSGFEEN
jgi:hypothetical protein